MAMEKLAFQKLDLQKQKIGEPIFVQFNPTEYSFEKSVKFGEIGLPGLNSPLLQFLHGESEKMTLELLFDGTASTGGGGGLGGAVGKAAGALAGAVMGGGGGKEDPPPVKMAKQVDAFYRMVKISGDLHTPPLVRVSWGEGLPGSTSSEGAAPRPDFDAAVERVSRRYTLFDPQGVPLRAVVSLTLREYRTLAEQLQELNLQSSDHTRIHTLREGETLPGVAYAAYKNPALWRLIAEENGIVHPDRVRPGQRLRLPPAPGGGRAS